MIGKLFLRDSTSKSPFNSAPLYPFGIKFSPKLQESALLLYMHDHNTNGLYLPCYKPSCEVELKRQLLCWNPRKISNVSLMYPTQE